MKPSQRRSSRAKPQKQTSKPEDITSGNETICNVCQAEFIDPTELKRHALQVHLRPFNIQRFCKFCTILHPSIEHYAKHVRDKHITNLKSCSLCSRLFQEQSELDEHVKKHESNTNKSMYSCSQCPILFSAIPDLQNHEVENHNDVASGIFLQSCYSYLSGMLNMKVERFLQSVEDKSKLTCVKCGYVTPNPDDYIKHLIKKKCMTYSCDICHSVYSGTQSMIWHITSHSKKIGKSGKAIVSKTDIVRCKYCKKPCIQSKMNQHIKKCPLVFKCTQCGITYDSIALLTDHQIKKHPLSASVFTCKYCPKQVVGKQALDRHIDKFHGHEIHLYVYPCVYCGTIFKHPKDLFTHFLSKHKNLKAFKCKLCNTEFRLRKFFTIHIKMVHNSKGKVQFDDNYHVYFSDDTHDRTLAEHNYNTTMAEGEPKETTDDLEYEVTDVEASGLAEKTTDIEVTGLTEEITDDVEMSGLMEKTTDDVEARGSAEKTTDDVEAGGLAEKTTDDAMDTIELLDDGWQETDAEQSAMEKDKRSAQVKKRGKTNKDKRFKKKPKRINDSSSDDEPLSKKLVKRKMHAFANRVRKGKMVQVKKRFTCYICKKYCFTFNNYNRHVSMHFKKKSKQCVKCAKLFKTELALKQHLTEAHATSKLTETLRRLIERRKLVNKSYTTPATESDRLRFTIKKVNFQNVGPQAVLNMNASDSVSARKYLENFVPDEADKVQIALVENVGPRKSTIKMTNVKLIKHPTYYTNKLRMPMKYSKPVNVTKPKVLVKYVKMEEPKPTDFDYDVQETVADDYDSPVEEDNIEVSKTEVADEIVSQEIYIQNVGDAPDFKITTDTPSSIFMRNLPKGIDNKIRIAHLLPVAPFYKIVKIDDIKPQKIEIEPKVELPNGAKLVSVNPLAHLIGDKEMPEVFSKYYKPKVKNYQNAVAKAMLELKTQPPKRVAVRKRKKKSAASQSTELDN